MRGAWKPVLSFSGLGLLGVLARQLVAPEPWLLFLVPLVIPPIVLAGLWWAHRPVREFLAGLREAGPVEVVRDEATWAGGRRTEARTPRGTWRLRLVYGWDPTLFVQGPGDDVPRPVEVPAREAARLAART